MALFEILFSSVFDLLELHEVQGLQHIYIAAREQLQTLKMSHINLYCCTVYYVRSSFNKKLPQTASIFVPQMPRKMFLLLYCMDYIDMYSMASPRAIYFSKS
jgi:hypothetical protein